MSLEIERLRELDSLIRIAHAQLGTLQLHLIEAHERALNPAELGVGVAELGRKISAWKRERGFLSRSIAESVQAAAQSEPGPGQVQEKPQGRGVARYRRATSARKARAASSEI